jgi:hypothetical protein
MVSQWWSERKVRVVIVWPSTKEVGEVVRLAPSPLRAHPEGLHSLIIFTLIMASAGYQRAENSICRLLKKPQR